MKCEGQDKGSRVVFGRVRHKRPPPEKVAIAGNGCSQNDIKCMHCIPIRRAATINVGAGQYQSRSVAMTMFPIIPPNRAATIDIATPVALKRLLIIKTLN